MSPSSRPPSSLRQDKKRITLGSLMPLQQVDLFFERMFIHNPSPETELVYINPYTLLVAVALSAQATDKGVNRATEPLFKVVSTPQQMLALGEEKLKEYIKTINFHRNKARHIMALSQILISKFEGEVPRDRSALESLPGVGRKTANVVLNVIFKEPTLAVDTHIFRVANRTGIAHGATPLKVELELEKRVPERWKVHAHHWLILHGRYICKALKPQCGKCFVSDICLYPDKTL